MLVPIESAFLLVVDGNLDSIWQRLRDTAAKMPKIDNFPCRIPIPATIRGCYLWSRSVLLGSAEQWRIQLWADRAAAHIDQNSGLVMAT